MNKKPKISTEDFLKNTATQLELNTATEFMDMFPSKNEDDKHFVQVSASYVWGMSIWLVWVKAVERKECVGAITFVAGHAQKWAHKKADDIREHLKKSGYGESIGITMVVHDMCGNRAGGIETKTLKEILMGDGGYPHFDVVRG